MIYNSRTVNPGVNNIIKEGFHVYSVVACINACQFRKN